jgi:hypothetical protein
LYTTYHLTIMQDQIVNTYEQSVPMWDADEQKQMI